MLLLHQYNSKARENDEILVEEEEECKNNLPQDSHTI